MAYLDIREINGYSIHYTDFHLSPAVSAAGGAGAARGDMSIGDESIIPHTLLYIGLPSNPQFVGPQTQEAVADVISRSTGPSGTNAEYLFRLEESLAVLGPGAEDMHVSGLAAKVRGLMAKEGSGN
jgi:cation transport regulator ChaC